MTISRQVSVGSTHQPLGSVLGSISALVECICPLLGFGMSQ